MMKPYYRDDAVQIFHGDCREILPQLEPVDLVLTDPPYGINANINNVASSRRGHKSKGYHGDGKDWGVCVGDDSPFDPAALLFFPQVILWGGNHYSDRLPVASRWLIWDKRCGKVSDDNADCEIAWTNLKGPARLFSHYWRGWIRAGEENLSRSGGKLHPFQKPIALIQWCINFAPDAQTVLDPFMGSGTTLRAAKDLGRKAIGIEIEEKYCEIAAKRMAQEVLAL